jgi:trimeric autotransporter adhesin
MKFQLKPIVQVLGMVIILGATGCGGGGGGGAVAPVAPASTTTSVSTTVIDGALKNAVVCMDVNLNGLCDASEVQGRTDAAGNVTLAIPNDDVGKYPLVAMVGTDAVDADNGPVTVPYSMTAPASRPSVLSPLTTLVQETVAATGVSIADAEMQLQSTTGINVSLFQDFTKVPAPTDGSTSASAVARMVVVTTQSQLASLASTVGTTAIDGTTISQTALNQVIEQRVLQVLPALVAVVNNPATAALPQSAQETAVINALSSSLLTTASVATVVAINNQTSASAAATTTTVVTATPTAALNLANLNFTDAGNWFVRTINASLVQNTPDANNKLLFVDRRSRSNSGTVANWNFGNNPSDQSNLHWNGTAWAACALNQEHVSTTRDAAGNGSYNYCDNYETGVSNRATFDVSSSSLSQVYDQIRAAGYTNLSIANTATLGVATFPTGSKLYYQTTTPLTKAFAYQVGSGALVKQYSAAVSAGGGVPGAPTIGCASAEFAVSPAIQATTLESLLAANTGTPCIFAPGSLTVGTAAGTVTFTSDAQNDAWGNSTLTIGTVGSVNVGGPATAYYTGNTNIRLSFAGSGTNPVTYYACKQRFITGGSRNCTPIGSGNYTITTLGDARVMTLSNPPAQAAALTYNRLFVERGGKVYYGYQDKQVASSVARMNITAAGALFTQLGLPAVDPEVPMVLTAASYQGVWDFRDAVALGGGVAVNLLANGGIQCTDNVSGLASVCSITSLNPATGAISLNNAGTAIVGTLGFMTGTGTGTYTPSPPDPLNPPGNFVATRR